MITIDKIKLVEIDQAKELLSRTWKATYGKHYSDEQIEKITKEWHDSKFLASQANDPKVYFAVAKDESGRMLGLITVRKIDNKTAFMARIYVDPASQGKNIGSQLLQSALSHFSTVKKLRVECEKQNNQACAFYLKKGFKIVGEKDEEVEGVKMRSVTFEKIIS